MTEYEYFIKENKNASPLEIWEQAINSYTSSIDANSLINTEILQSIIEESLTNMEYSEDIQEFIDEYIDYIKECIWDDLDRTIESLVREN